MSGVLDDITKLLSVYPINLNKAELYADIFAWADDEEQNMPQKFRHFYDWRLAKILREKVVQNK